MTYRGKMCNGVVVLEDAKGPPEGAAVNVEVVAPRKQRLNKPQKKKHPDVWDKLLKLAGTVKGLPPDMARNHDHYIHGAPRK